MATGRKYVKAPDAPKRFKSAYMFFSSFKHKDIRQKLDRELPTPEISKMVSSEWKSLSPEERSYWDELARRDKERYEVEKSMYVGPWKVLKEHVSSTKHADAPKRPMSAFIVFSNEYRAKVQKQHPEATLPQLSRILGQMWRAMDNKKRQAYMDREHREMVEYKAKRKQWKDGIKAKQEAGRRKREDAAMKIVLLNEKNEKASPTTPGSQKLNKSTKKASKKVTSKAAKRPSPKYKRRLSPSASPTFESAARPKRATMLALATPNDTEKFDRKNASAAADDAPSAFTEEHSYTAIRTRNAVENSVREDALSRVSVNALGAAECQLSMSRLGQHHSSIIREDGPLHTTERFQKYYGSSSGYSQSMSASRSSFFDNVEISVFKPRDPDRALATSPQLGSIASHVKPESKVEEKKYVASSVPQFRLYNPADDISPPVTKPPLPVPRMSSEKENNHRSTSSTTRLLSYQRRSLVGTQTFGRNGEYGSNSSTIEATTTTDLRDHELNGSSGGILFGRYPALCQTQRQSPNGRQDQPNADYKSTGSRGYDYPSHPYDMTTFESAPSSFFTSNDDRTEEGAAHDRKFVSTTNDGIANPPNIRRHANETDRSTEPTSWRSPHQSVANGNEFLFAATTPPTASLSPSTPLATGRQASSAKFYRSRASHNALAASMRQRSLSEGRAQNWDGHYRSEERLALQGQVGLFDSPPRYEVLQMSPQRSPILLRHEILSPPKPGS